MTTADSLHLRRETAADLALIRKVETAAFDRPAEASLVEALRAAGALLFSGVAEVDGNIVGHIACSPVVIEGERGRLRAIALAPMAVHPDWQRQGIGAALIRWSLDECRRDPRFGFVTAMPLGVRCPFEAPSEAFMLLELRPDALAGRTGTARYRQEFASL